MNGHAFRRRIGAGLLLGAATVLACSSSGDGGEAPVDATDASADTNATTMPDASATDRDAGESVDATTDAAVDAAPRTCSDENFCRTPLPPNQVLRAVWGDGQGTVWAVSQGGSVLRWTGEAWSIHSSRAGESYFSIWGFSPTDIWIGTDTGLLHGTGPSAAAITFEPVDIPGDDTIPSMAIWGSSPDDIWVAGGFISRTPPYSARGRVVHLVNGEWTEELSVASNFAYSHVWGTPSSGIWVSGNSITRTGFGGTTLLRRAVGQDSFSAEDLPQAPNGAALANPSRIDGAASTSDTTMVVLGATSTAGGVRVTGPAVWRGSSTDQGATFTWSAEPKTLPGTLADPFFALTTVWARSPEDTWAAGEFGRLRHFDGTSWTEAKLTVAVTPEISPLYGIWGKEPGDFWVVGDNLAIHKTSASSP